MLQHDWFRSARVVAIYRANAYEVDLQTLQEHGLATGKTILVPRTQSNGRMHMLPVSKATRWRRGSFNIEEPNTLERFGKQQFNLMSIDLVCAPLSAFDAHFARVGMGGGYYDRYFATRKFADKCRFVGVAFDCQQTTTINQQAHDVCLDAIATESGVSCRRSADAHLCNRSS